MMNASIRSRTSSKNTLRPSQIRRRSSRRHPFTEYIRNGARVVSDALNALATVFAQTQNNTRNTDRVVRFGRERTPEGDFYRTVAPFPGDDDGVTPTAQVGDNAGTGSHNQPIAQPQPHATSVSGVVLVAIPTERRVIRRRDGTIAPPAQPSWQDPISLFVARPLQAAAGTQPSAAPRRRAPLQREGAFHEDLMPLDAPARQEVAGRDPSTLYENLVWEAQWGPIPRFTDIAGYGDAPPTTPQVLAYLNDRFRFNRRAYNAALDVLFPPEGSEPRDPPIVRGEPAFQRVAPTALWRRDADWEGGVVPVDREWGAPAQADDAADPEAPPFDPAEFAYSDAAVGQDMAELTDEELRAIGAHISACLAARHTPVAAPFPFPSHSMSLPGPSSIAPSRSASSRKATRGTQGTRNAVAASSSSRKLRSASRPQPQPRSRAQAFTRRSDRRSAARARLQETIRKNLKKGKLARAARSSSSSLSSSPSSSSRRSSPRFRPQTRASTAARSLPPSPRTPAAASTSASPSRELRSAKRARREEDAAAASSAGDGSPRNKRARRS